MDGKIPGKTGFRAFLDRTLDAKSLIFRQGRGQIPQTTEQGIKLPEQGIKSPEQGVKSRLTQNHLGTPVVWERQ
jgi:hypothetical protein